MRQKFALLVLALCCAVPEAALAQQTGAIIGKVIDSTGGALPGVTVEAKSDVLPSPRTTVTGPTGEYRLPALPPGNYSVQFTLSGMQPVTRQAQVQLSLETLVDATLGVQAVAEVVNVMATTTLVDRGSSTVKSALTSEQFKSLPVGQEYRDLIKLIPGVQYTQELHARSELRRQRPGQRLPVRRRERHAAAVRHAVGRAGVARHRADHDHEGWRARRGLRPLRGLLGRLR